MAFTPFDIPRFASTMLLGAAQKLDGSDATLSGSGSQSTVQSSVRYIAVPTADLVGGVSLPTPYTSPYCSGEIPDDSTPSAPGITTGEIEGTYVGSAIVSPPTVLFPTGVLRTWTFDYVMPAQALVSGQIRTKVNSAKNSKTDMPIQAFITTSGGAPELRGSYRYNFDVKKNGASIAVAQALGRPWPQTGGGGTALATGLTLGTVVWATPPAPIYSQHALVVQATPTTFDVGDVLSLEYELDVTSNIFISAGTTVWARILFDHSWNVSTNAADYLRLNDNLVVEFST